MMSVSVERTPVVLSDRLAPFRQWPAALRTRLGQELFQLLGSYSDLSAHGLAAAALAARSYSGREHHRVCQTVDAATHAAVVLHLLNHALKACVRPLVCCGGASGVLRVVSVP